MDDIIEMKDIIDYCKKCKCRYIRTKEDYNRFNEPLKTCLKCRIRNSKRKFKYSPSITKGLE
jgi:hypothetical protein